MKDDRLHLQMSAFQFRYINKMQGAATRQVTILADIDCQCFSLVLILEVETMSLIVAHLFASINKTKCSLSQS
jgi:hypothetical protein